MKTYPEINGMDRRDVTEAIKLGRMNYASVKPEFQADLRDRLAAMEERLRRLDATEKRVFEIQSRNLNHQYSKEWDPSAVGRDGNEFETAEEAEAMIPELRKLGEDWAESEYRVVEIKD